MADFSKKRVREFSVDTFLLSYLGEGRGELAFVTSLKALPGNNIMLGFEILTQEFGGYLQSITSNETEPSLANPNIGQSKHMDI